MFAGSSSPNLVIGLAALGLTVVVAGVRMSRRKRARRAAEPPEADATFEAGSGKDDSDQPEGGPDGPEAQTQGRAMAADERFLLEFFVWVFVLAVPFWIFGGGKLPLPINLPVGALATFLPAIAASIVSYRQFGSTGVRRLIKKALDYRKIRNKIWLLPTILLMPLIHLIAYGVMRLMGRPLPDPVEIPLLMAPVFFVMFFIGDAGEELGWSGYAIDPMQNRWGALRAGLFLGIVWVIWHLIPWVQTGNPASWILWQGLFSVALRILIVWIYDNSGRSVFAAILFHDMANISWSLFPNYGSHFDPFVVGLLTWLAALIVALVWEPITLTRLRHVRVSG
jgi:membrane protease YdiL (CAAX protease family)